jgi:carbon-monoxide dehydrogenase medium subunit
MYPTTHHKPADVSRAAELVSGAEDGKLLAGGMTLLPTMKQHLAAPTDLVDLGGIADLKGITVSGDTLTIGAMTTHRTVAGSAEVAAFCPAIATLAGGIGDPAVRARGTIGGSLANNDPSACYPSAVLALGATIHTNTRQIAAADYFQGMFATALEPGEVITAVSFPRPAKAAYAKFPNPASRYAMVGVFVAQTAGGARVAVTGAGEGGVFRHEGFEGALNGNWSAAALDAVETKADGLLGDIHASPAYRAHLIRVIAKRAVAATV